MKTGAVALDVVTIIYDRYMQMMSVIYRDDAP